MAKNRLSKVQQRRVEEKHNKRLINLEQEYDDTTFSVPQDGIVISRFGKVADVEGASGLVSRCNIRRTLASIVTGDRVIWRANNDPLTNGIIEAIQPRHSELVRPDFYDGIKTVAANIDQIMIILAVVPELSLNILDRYLVACAVTKIKPIIVLNKIDLLNAEQQQKIADTLAYYQSLDYCVLYLSCKNTQGFENFTQQLQNKISVLVGQSGVGKSSIVHQLLPESAVDINVGDVSESSGLGQHTTTSTRLYHLPCGGDIIDSPGIREFGLWHLTQDQVMQGFIEFYDYLTDCRFRDCNHLTDIDCGLQKAASLGKIADWRLDNYHRILQSMHDIKAKTNRTFK